jgi:outer membrane lipoprotein-sorting protein
MAYRHIFFFFFSGILLFSSFRITAQSNPSEAKAKKILDGLSSKNKAYKSIQAEFSILVENKANRTNEKQDGRILVKGKKYRIETSGQTVINDSKSIHTIIKEAAEIQLSDADEKEKSENAITPSNIFSIYEKGFKFEFVKEEKTKKGNVVQIVKLYPTEPKKKNYHTLVLTIDKQKAEITSFRIMGKDGTETTYTIRKFLPNANISEDSFSFNQKNYPGYELIDLR